MDGTALGPVPGKSSLSWRPAAGADRAGDLRQRRTGGFRVESLLEAETMTIRRRVKIKPGGRIEIHSPDLPVGEEAEVVITLEDREDELRLGEAEYDVNARPYWEEVLEIGASVPMEEWEKVPTDLSKNLDHYLYGAPREEE